MSSIKEYYSTYSTPITDVQIVALRVLCEMMNLPFLDSIRELTYGEARDLIIELHDKSG